MVTLTIDEITLNATRAALDERVTRLEEEVAEADRQVTSWGDGRTWPQDYSEDFQRALVWNTAALHETKMAQEFYAEVEPSVDYPADMSYHDFQAVGPR